MAIRGIVHFSQRQKWCTGVSLFFRCYLYLFFLNKERYLSEPGRIAVIPSVVDNTPYTVYECLFAGIPFVASNIPSIASLIVRSDQTR